MYTILSRHALLNRKSVIFSPSQVWKMCHCFFSKARLNKQRMFIIAVLLSPLLQRTIPRNQTLLHVCSSTKWLLMLGLFMEITATICVMATVCLRWLPREVRPIHGCCLSTAVGQDSQIYFLVQKPYATECQMLAQATMRATVFMPCLLYGPLSRLFPNLLALCKPSLPTSYFPRFIAPTSF